ncbi:MAG: sigma-70 family RNA polymerase sigma factor [Lysobacteraceae bacterium]
MRVTFAASITNGLSGAQVRASEDQLKAWMIGGLEGDAAVYATLLGTLVPLLRSFYKRRLFDAADDIEDLVQETLIAIHNRRASYDRTRPFVAWLYAVARYKMVDHLRSRRLHVPAESIEDLLVDEGQEEAWSAQMDLERLLDGIPAKQAQVIRDTRLLGLSIADAAEKNGISESDVKVSVHRGMKALAARQRRSP